MTTNPYNAIVERNRREIAAINEAIVESCLNDRPSQSVGQEWLEGMRRPNQTPTFQSPPDGRFDDGIPEREPVPGDILPGGGEGVPCVLSKAKRRR